MGTSIERKLQHAINKKAEIVELLGLSGNPTWSQIISKIEDAGFSNKIVDRTITSVSADDLKNLTSIGDYAFYHCTSLASVELPNTITSIGENAFNGCTSLTSITLPSSVTELKARCFSGTRLVNVVLPSGITNLPSGVFQNQTIETITITCNQVCTLEYYSAVVRDSPSQINKTKIYVPASLKSSYESASQWSTALNYNYIEFKAIVEGGN